jgi:uncharacterized protein
MKHLLITTIAAVVLVGCGKTPEESFLKAVEDGETGLVEDYINSGGAIDVRTLKGQTPLLLAASGGHTETIKILIENGANVNKESAAELTPLMGASISGNVDSVKLLLDNGARVNEACALGTALHFACMANNSSIIKVLVESGADLNISDKNGRTPLDLFSLTDQLKDIDLLRKHGGKTGEELKAEGK